MYAEVQVNIDGVPNNAAMDALNLIRKRAGLGAFINKNKEAFLNAVWDQRYFELCYENKMWFDMLRTRLIREDKTVIYVPFVGYKLNWGMRIDSNAKFEAVQLTGDYGHPWEKPTLGIKGKMLDQKGKSVEVTLVPEGAALSLRVTFLNELSSAEDAALLPEGSKIGVGY